MTLYPFCAGQTADSGEAEAYQSGGMRALEGPDGEGNIFELPAPAVVDLAGGHALHHDLEGFAVDVGCFFRADTKKADLVGRRAAPNAEFETAAAQLVEHADLFGQADGIVDGQQIDERAEAHPLRPLRDRGEPDARGRREAQRRAMVFADLIDVEAAPVAKLDQLQAVLVLLMRRKAVCVVLVEKAEFHVRLSVSLRVGGQAFSLCQQRADQRRHSRR